MTDANDPFAPKDRRHLVQAIGGSCLVVGAVIVVIAGYIAGPSEYEWPGLLELVLGILGIALLAIGYRLLKGEWFDFSNWPSGS